jgi:hypothetical protein
VVKFGDCCGREKRWPDMQIVGYEINSAAPFANSYNKGPQGAELFFLAHTLQPDFRLSFSEKILCSSLTLSRKSCLPRNVFLSPIVAG